MKLLRLNEAKTDSRSDGRTVRTLLTQVFDEPIDSIVFYLVDVPGGRFDKHYHSKAHEVIWFPTGGKVFVNDQLYEMAPWDAIFLEPGDSHHYDGSDIEGEILHFAVKMPAADDKVPVAT